MRQLQPKTKLNLVIFFALIFSLLALNFTNFSFKHFLPSLALVAGIILSALHNDDTLIHHAKLWSNKVLSYAIIFLGFGFNLNNILKAGISGIGYTVISIAGTLLLGLLIGKWLKTADSISILISSGTAICGGSAIAAIAPLIRAKHATTAVAMGTIFLLNGIGLILFPLIGHYLQLNQNQFGLFAALAIHDTSSVVGSCLAYGSTALMVGTTVKLVRALWIIPVSLIIALIYTHQNPAENSGLKVKKPWFILWFLLASLSVTILPALHSSGLYLKAVGESLFVIALFLIGYTVSFKSIQAVGAKVFIQAITLWLIVSSLVILALKLNWLH